MNKRILRKSAWSSLSKVIGVALGSGAGTIIHQALGDNVASYSVAFVMAISSFGLIMIAEYRKESE